MLMKPKPVTPFRNAAPKKDANAIMRMCVSISVSWRLGMRLREYNEEGRGRQAGGFLALPWHFGKRLGNGKERMKGYFFILLFLDEKKER